MRATTGSLAVALALLGAARAASAQTPPRATVPATTPTVQYTTVAGDTCTTVAEHVYGSPTRIDVIHLYNNLGPMPHRFAAGRVLTLPRVPPPPRATADAEVSFVRNDVRSYTPADHPARVLEPLSRGHRVGTNAASSADVSMASERSVHLEENTLVVVLGRYSFQSQQRETAQDTQLERGTLRTQLAALAGAPPPQAVAVATPGAQVAASPGETEVTVDAARTTRVGVLSGQAEVSAQRQRVVVPEGQGTSVELGRPPSPPRPLPPRPEWDRSPPHVAFLEGGTSSAFGSYRVANRAASVTQWHVQLARDERFRELLVDRRVDAPVVRFDARELPEGQYFLRVRSIDAQHFESQPSLTQRFAVVIPEYVASIPGRRAAVRVLDGLYCGLDGAPATETSAPIELSPGRAHTLRCADAASGEGGSDLEIPAARSGLILAQARVGEPEWTPAGGTRRVAIRVTDAVGAPLAGFDVTPTVDHDAAVTLAPSHEAGTHFAIVRWRGPAVAYTLRLAVAGSEVASVSLPAVARPPASPLPAPAPAPRRPPPPADPRFTAGVALGGIVDTGPLGPGLAADVHVRYRIPLNVVDLFVGLGVGVQRFACEGGTAAPGGYCTQPAVGPQDPRIAFESASFGVALGVSRRVGSILRLYVLAEPQAVLGRSRIVPSTTPDGPLRAGLGARGMLGAQFDLGIHVPFVEVGYRYAMIPDDRLGTLDAGGPVFNVGYAVRW